MPLSDSILARLRYQHETIGELIANLPEEQLRRRVDPAKWSAFENIAHLASYQPVFLQRINRIQNEADPFFDRYVAEADPAFPATLQESLPRLLEKIRSDRQTIRTLLQGMTEAALGRMGLHARYGRFPLSQWTEFFLLHEAHHLYTIFMIVQELRKISRE